MNPMQEYLKKYRAEKFERKYGFMLSLVCSALLSAFLLAIALQVYK